MKKIKSYVAPPEKARSFPLFGLYGCAKYSLNLVLQQLGAIQDTPLYDLKDEYDRCYDKLTADDLARFLSRWEATKVVPVIREQGVTTEYETWRAGRMTQENLPRCPRATLHNTIAQLTKQLADIGKDLLQEQSNRKRDRGQIREEKQETERIKVKYEELQKEIKKLRERLDEAYARITKQKDSVEFWKDGAEKGRDFRNRLCQDVQILRKQLQDNEEENRKMVQESTRLRTELLAEQRIFKRTKVQHEASSPKVKGD